MEAAGGKLHRTRLYLHCTVDTLKIHETFVCTAADPCLDKPGCFAPDTIDDKSCQ